jgi:hypothetical protein
MSEPVATPVSAESLSEALSSAPQTSDKSELVLDDSTMNHLSYKATNKVPFVIDYFGIRDFYESNPAVTEMAKELHTLLVDADSDTPISETKDILDALSQELNLQEDDAPFYKLKRTLFLAKLRDEMAQNREKKLRMLADSEGM